MSGNLRREALTAFKKLRRTCLKTFQGDDRALKITRQRAQDEFRKNQFVTDQPAVEELIKLANDVEHEIRTTVIQAVEKGPGRYEIRITPDTVKLDNVPYSEPADASKLFGPMKKCSDPPVK